MMSYTQDELSSIWKKLTDGTEHDEVDWNIVSDIDVEQTLSHSKVATYSDYNDNGRTVSYTRKRMNKEAPWGMWER
ncbi:MAG TPA: hypothetical protein VGB94_13870 [Acidobacteriaceae bacterium]